MHHDQSALNESVAEFRFKVVLLGDLATGKTSLIQRYINNSFKEGQAVPFLPLSPLSESISTPGEFQSSQ